MALWIRRTELTGASVDRNGTNDHTCTFQPAAVGNFLVAVVGGPVTFTTPSGWTQLVNAVGDTGLYVFIKSAAGSESSFTVTHNGANYPIEGVVYEFAAGTTSIASNFAVSQPYSSPTGPTVTGLSGIYTRFTVRNNPMGSGSTVDCAWTVPGIEDYDVYVARDVTDGIGMSIAYDDNCTGASFTPSYNVTGANLGSGGGEVVAFALNVVSSLVPPIAEYSFNETSGTTAADSSGNGYDLTLPLEANLAVGKAGNGLHQVGGGSGYLVSNPTAWLETSPERSMMFWGYRGDEGTNGDSPTVYQLDGSGNTTFGMSLSNGTSTTFTVRQGGTEVVLTNVEVPVAAWALYTLTYDQQNINVYIGDTLVATQAAIGAIDASDGNLYMFGGDNQNQIIDDLRFFDVALNADQVAYYASLPPIQPPDLDPPSKPTGLNGSAAGQVVSLTWDAATDNIAVKNYIVYRSSDPNFVPGVGDQVGGPDTPGYSSSTPVGTWYFRVAARDEAGNISEPSDAVQIVSSPGSDYYFPSALGWSDGTQFINDTMPSGFTAGIIFALSASSPIIGIRFNSPEAQTGLKIALYANNVLVASRTGLAVDAGWNTLLYDNVYSGNPGIDYMVTVYIPGPTPSYYALVNAPWPTSGQINVGPMYTGLAADSRIALNDSMPTSSSSNWYGIDAVVASEVVIDIDESFGATVEEENAKEGSFGTEWDISGAGDVSNLGFARQFSVNAGDTVDFSCHGDGEIIDIYRIGYYDNRGWRRVARLDNTPTSQPDPDVIPNSNGGVACTNWSVTATWQVPAGALSGLFVGVFRNAGQSNASYIPFIVRNDSRSADVAYKTSDTTWALAYNYYGTPGAPLTGKSVYGSGGPLGNISTRTHALSYHRPIVTREGVPQTYWLACEAPMIRFLERNGIDIKYVASRDVDQTPGILNGTNIAVSSGHDEYWSTNMREAFKSYRDSGGNITFFSGNEVFWRTRFSDADTMWCYKDTMDGPGAHVAGTPLDPVTWTGTWKDTRWAEHEPENLLTGTDFRMNGVNDYAAVFASVYGSHPFWRNTTLGSGNIAVNGLIGFEADSALPAQPAGSYVYLNQYVLNINGSYADDNGQNYSGQGDLNWGIVSQRYASGAVVVGFGTCQWAWGLDNVHDRGGAYAHSAVQQATLNLFADLGAAPATTMPGLTAPVAVPSLDVYGLIPASGRSGKVKVWSGTQWNAHPAKVWDGSQWVTRKVKGHDGTDFIDGKG